MQHPKLTPEMVADLASGTKYLRDYSQNAAEFDWWLEIVKREGVKSYLEIGSQWGGALWKAAHVLPAGSRLVSVDYPTPHKRTRATESKAHLENCVAHLRREGYDAHLKIGDSTDPEVVEWVRSLGPFDAVFIDGHHRLNYVASDWKHYGAISRIVAFHDINWQQRPIFKTPIEVPTLWNQIKRDYRHEEIRLDKRDNGIGVLWR